MSELMRQAMDTNQWTFDMLRDPDWRPDRDSYQSMRDGLVARLRTVEAERDEAWEVVQRFLTEDEADDPDEPKPTLAALVKRCFDWGDGAWYQAGTQMEAHRAAEARVEALEAALHGIADLSVEMAWTAPTTARAALAVSGNQPQ